MPRLAAVIDANILFRRYVRDTLLFAAEAELFRPLWTDKILHEATFHLVDRRHLTQGQADGLIAALRAHFPGAWVEVSQANLAKSVTRDPGDRHVLAAAIEEGATIIVTENVSDFPAALTSQHGVMAKKADDFLLGLFGADSAGLVAAVLKQQVSYTAAPVTLTDLLARLDQIVPRTVAAIKGHLGL